MADVEFSREMGGYDAALNVQGAQGASVTQSLVTATNIAGAVMSLALIAGVGVWGYKLMVRDVSGIPIVRAAQGDMRVRPEDPGGQLAQNQGLAVNEIAAQGVASGPVDQVTLAPPAVALADEDQPLEVAAPAPAEVERSPAEILASASAPVPQDAEPTGQIEDIDALVAQLMSEADAEPSVTAEGPKFASARPVDASISSDAADVEPVLAGLQQSVRPRLRPAGSVAMVQPASYTPAPESTEIDPSAIPPGTRLAQLGAFDSPDVARSEWVRLQQRFGSILGDKSRVIEEAQSGGRTFYRLRAMGFVDLSDTRRFCSAIKAEGVDCIPVQVK